MLRSVSELLSVFQYTISMKYKRTFTLHACTPLLRTTDPLICFSGPSFAICDRRWVKGLVVLAPIPRAPALPCRTDSWWHPCRLIRPVRSSLGKESVHYQQKLRAKFDVFSKSLMVRPARPAAALFSFLFFLFFFWKPARRVCPPEDASANFESVGVWRWHLEQMRFIRPEQLLFLYYLILCFGIYLCVLFCSFRFFFCVSVDENGFVMKS